MRTITTTSFAPFRPGDRIKFAADTNRVRRHITELVNGTTANFAVYLRPSRGYAKHVRGNKSHANMAV